MLERFSTLLHREWMQDKVVWIISICVPTLIALGLLAVGKVEWTLDDADVTIQLAALPATTLAMGAIASTAGLTLLIAWFTALFQSPGLARRDQQDRSIEFWLSLPTGHVPSLAAPMLAHLLLFPIIALVVGVVSGHLISLVLLAKVASLGDWFTLPWGTMLAATLAWTARMVLGIVLATLWISPLVLLAMAASAWLKRWGLPALVATLVVAGNLLEKLYGNPVVWDTLQLLLKHAGQSLLGTQQGPVTSIRQSTRLPEQLSAMPAWMAEDAGRAIVALANPLLLYGLLVSAACFALLVIRRRRGT